MTLRCIRNERNSLIYPCYYPHILPKAKVTSKRIYKTFGTIQSEQNSSHLVQVHERLWEKMVSEAVYIFVWGAPVPLERYAKVCISDLHEAIEKLHKCLLFNLHGAFKKKFPLPLSPYHPNVTFKEHDIVRYKLRNFFIFQLFCGR